MPPPSQYVGCPLHDVLHDGGGEVYRATRALLRRDRDVRSLHRHRIEQVPGAIYEKLPAPPVTGPHRQRSLPTAHMAQGHRPKRRGVGPYPFQPGATSLPGVRCARLRVAACEVIADKGGDVGSLRDTQAGPMEAAELFGGGIPRQFVQVDPPTGIAIEHHSEQVDRRRSCWRQPREVEGEFLALCCPHPQGTRTLRRHLDPLAQHGDAAEAGSGQGKFAPLGQKTHGQCPFRELPT